MKNEEMIVLIEGLVLLGVILISIGVIIGEVTIKKQEKICENMPIMDAIKDKNCNGYFKEMK